MATLNFKHSNIPFLRQSYQAPPIHAEELVTCSQTSVLCTHKGHVSVVGVGMG